MNVALPKPFGANGIGRQRASGPRASQVAAILFGLFICIFIGLAIPFLPWWMTLGLVIGPLVIIGGAAWPFPVLVFSLALIFEVLPGRLSPSVGSFRIYELVVMYLAVVVFLRALWFKESLLKPMGPFVWPMLYLLLCVLVSVAYVRFFAPNPWLLTELRGYVTWLLLPLLCLTIRTPDQRSFLFGFVIFTAAVVSCYGIAQAMTGIHLLNARVSALDVTNSDVTRAAIGGTVHLAAFTLFWVVNKVGNGTRMTPLLILLGLICAAGIAVSFGRAIWLSTAFGFLVASWFNRGLRGMFVSALIGALAIALLLATFSLAQPRFAEALIERATGISKEIESGGSFGFRFSEAAYAIDALKKRPLTGVGIGGEYKISFATLAGFDVEARYIHNAYLGFMVKMGVQAILFQIAIVAMFIAIAFRIRRTIATSDRAMFSALVGAFTVPVISSLTQPEWLTGAGIAVFCVFITLLIKLMPAQLSLVPAKP